MRAFGLTDQGKVRSENQDTYEILQLSEKRLLCVICDGMGGAQAGAVASRLACDAFLKSASAGMKSPDSMQQALKQAVADANRLVYERACMDESCRGMGTTLTALAVWGKDACAVNVGDSRVYVIDESGIGCLTKDHSVVAWMVQNGEISSEQAKQYPGKNMITRAVGTEPEVECDLYPYRRKAGDAFLLCSDGLSNQLADQELLFEIAHGSRKEDCCERLLQIALERGAPDNVSMILVCD